MTHDNERIAKLEFLLEHLSKVIEEHMEREELERKELLNLIKHLSDKIDATAADYNDKKNRVVGGLAVLSVLGAFILGVLELLKFWKH